MVEDEAERWLGQLRKGSTRLAVLQLVSETERYGYEILTEIRTRTRGTLNVAEGNLYPALHALEKEGYVRSYWREVEPGIPARKYYQITERGRRLHERVLEGWGEFSLAMSDLIEGGKKK